MSAYRGLTEAKAVELLEKEGRNSFEARRKNPAITIFLGQFRDILVLILLIATAVSFFLGDIVDSVTIIVIVLLNSLLGFFQEYRTERTLETLRAMTAPTARVIRDGKERVVPAEEIVRGDLIMLSEGDRIPADCVLISEGELCCDESLLTGESCAAPKLSGELDKGEWSHDNMLFSGCSVIRGGGRGVVVKTGKSTEMGAIASMLGSIEQSKTPLQKRLGELGSLLGLICLGVCAVVFAAGLLRGEPFFDMLMTSISIAIAAIPEGLPATVTIALAMSVRRMLRRGALVSRLHSVETLGCSSVICTDKTGTLTENRMTVIEIATLEHTYKVTGNGYDARGHLTEGEAILGRKRPESLTELLGCMVLCNDASLKKTHGSGEWDFSGDPTEAALLISAAKAGVTAKSTESYRRTGDIAFDSDRKMMTVFCGERSFTKGAPEAVLNHCNRALTDNGIVPMTSALKKRLLGQCAERTTRVLAFAENDEADSYQAERNMVYLGFAGMHDPPRKEAAEAVRQCRKARLRVVMITGDQLSTALEIAERVGIVRGVGDRALTGAELDLMSDEELSSAVKSCSVFARVSPAHKLRIVRAFRLAGEIVTMTGDGVNDAPAIKEADVGVAMGKNGTAVSRDAADIVLLDDNFATLVSAVSEGRCVYANIRKFVRYLLSCNIGEVLTMFLGILLGYPVVLLPAQLLLVNLVTDGLPAIALGFESPSSKDMSRPPRPSGESFFARGLASMIAVRGILIGLISLASFSLTLSGCGTLPEARTAALITLVVSQLLHVFECRSEEGNIFTVGLLGNLRLVAAVVLSALALWATIAFAPLRFVFGTVVPSWEVIRTALLLAAAPSVLNVFFGRKH